LLLNHLIVGDLILWVLFLHQKVILVVVDYVNKWAEAIPTKSADGETSLKMLKNVIFPRFGVPRYLMTDRGSHFIHGGFRKTLARYDVNHRIAYAYDTSPTYP
jgi:hypothetical protein